MRVIHVGEDDCLPSMYESSISHNLAMNPQHKLSHCDITSEDLRLNNIVEVLQNWTNLKSISLTLTGRGLKMDLKMCSGKLNSIFEGSSRLDVFEIISKTRNMKQWVLHLLYCFKAHGYKFKSFSVVDHAYSLKLDDFIKLLNECPNLEMLNICGLDSTVSQRVTL